MATDARQTVKTDVSRPARLETGQSRIGASQAAPGSTQSETSHGAARLDSIAETANKTIDEEVHTLVEGFRNIVQLSTLADKDEFRITQDTLQMHSRADGMVRAAHNLLLMSKALSLSLILSTSPSSAQAQQEAEQLRKHAEEHGASCALIVAKLLSIDSQR